MFAPIHHTRTSKDRPTEWFARHDWITNIDNNREWIYTLTMRTRLGCGVERFCPLPRSHRPQPFSNRGLAIKGPDATRAFRF